MIAGVELQITEQRSRIGGQLKSERDVNFVKEQQLTKQIDALSREISQTEEQRVKLAALDREATANRELYQQLLSRTKATNELAQQPSDNVRVVSPAVPPLISTRPPLILLVPFIAFFSVIFAVLLVAAADFFRLRSARDVRSRRAQNAAPVGEPAERDGASVNRSIRRQQKQSLLSLIPDN
jgi:uncharacterized protein involved in exopolysaccharide biosynthesis